MNWAVTKKGSIKTYKIPSQPNLYLPSYVITLGLLSLKTVVALCIISFSTQPPLTAPTELKSSEINILTPGFL